MAYRNVEAAQERLRKFADSVSAYSKGLVAEIAEYRSSHGKALSYITRLSDAWDIMRRKLEQRMTTATKRLEGFLGNETVVVDFTEFQEGALVKKKPTARSTEDGSGVAPFCFGSESREFTGSNGTKR